MRFKKIGSSGPLVSQLGMGCLHFGIYLPQDQVMSLVSMAIDNGITFFDTAPIYGGNQSETLLGKAIVGKRDGIFISTKVGLEEIKNKEGMFSVQSIPLNKVLINKFVDSSLRMLAIEKIDLLQLHAFNKQTNFYELFLGIEELIYKEKIDYFGVSNYDSTELISMIKCMPVSLRTRFITCQVHYNFLERRAEQEIFALCKENSLGIIVNRVLARGLLGGKYSNSADFPSNSRAALSKRVAESFTYDMLCVAEAVTDFSRRINRSPAEVVINWTLKNDSVTTVLTGTRNENQLKECINAFQWLLDDDQFQDLEKILEKNLYQSKAKLAPLNFFEK